jgi:hypothetical protein
MVCFTVETALPLNYAWKICLLGTNRGESACIYCTMLVKVF